MFRNLHFLVAMSRDASRLLLLSMSLQRPTSRRMRFLMFKITSCYSLSMLHWGLPLCTFVSRSGNVNISLGPCTPGLCPSARPPGSRLQSLQGRGSRAQASVRLSRSGFKCYAAAPRLKSPWPSFDGSVFMTQAPGPRTLAPALGLQAPGQCLYSRGA